MKTKNNDLVLPIILLTITMSKVGTLKNKFVSKRKWVTVVTVSDWYADLFENWLFWYRQLDLGMETIVIAEDKVVFEKYCNSSEFETIHFSNREVSACLTLSFGQKQSENMFFQITNSTGINMNFKQPGFNSLTSRRPYYLLKLLKNHTNIIYSDIDTVWMKDPRPYFKGHLDFWAQIDGVIDGIPYFEGYIPFICTGFLALRSTKKSVKMLRQWLRVIKTDPLKHQDQEVIQKIAFELSVDFGVLPMKYFPNGNIYFKSMSRQERNEVALVHNNYIVGKERKIKRFKDFHLWAEEYINGKNICHTRLPT